MMTTKAIYLLPKSGLKSPLRSDTLWAGLCWAIRLLHGDKVLREVLRGYTATENSVQPFYISSAFPFVKEEDKTIHFFPKPLVNKTEDIDFEQLNFQETKTALRTKKIEQKPLFISEEAFNLFLNGKDYQGTNNVNAPSIKTVTITHNTINRLLGATLTINDAGQLFHTENLKIRGQVGQQTGWFFLAKGNLEILQAPLRFLQHYGIGGDRTIGKGQFDIQIADVEFTFQEPQTTDALINLSLYHPNTEELDYFGGEQFQYKLEQRQGWSGHLHERRQLKAPVLYFSEGSVFPLVKPLTDNILGQNRIVFKRPDYDVQQYGYGFMINAKLSSL